uniref:Insulin receptor substrate 2 n=1 Tax=Falco tinnunculus TaxID=100819 RepID=A0A8C4VB75_FALTI
PRRGFVLPRSSRGGITLFYSLRSPPPVPVFPRKCGYLRKQKHGHKRFFVLRGPSGGEEAGGARLEYYESEKKWRNKSGAPKRVIALDSCLNINKRADAKHKYLIALYTKDEYFAVAAENEQEQEGWYRALTDLLNEGKAACQGSPHRHLASPFSVWQVTLKPKGLGQSKNLTGVHRLCLSARTIGFVRLNCELPTVTLQLMNIRRCGHSDSFFFIEVGRSAATGPGELWMQADDSVVAQNIHETILEAMKAASRPPPPPPEGPPGPAAAAPLPPTPSLCPVAGTTIWSTCLPARPVSSAAPAPTASPPAPAPSARRAGCGRPARATAAGWARWPAAP